MDSENRVLLAGLVAAVVGGAVLAGLVLLDVLPDRLMGVAAYAWPITAGIVAPQLYLAARGVGPTRVRRSVAVLFGAFALWLALGSYLEPQFAFGAVLALLLVGLCYEVYLGYRDAHRDRDETSAREL